MKTQILFIIIVIVISVSAPPDAGVTGEVERLEQGEDGEVIEPVVLLVLGVDVIARHRHRHLGTVPLRHLVLPCITLYNVENIEGVGSFNLICLAKILDLVQKKEGGIRFQIFQYMRKFG